MVFNSLEFALFFVLFFFLYWLIFNRNLRIQNLLILAASYVFLAWWDWRFLSILAGSSVVNYFLGIYIEKTQNEKHKRFLIYLGLLQGLGSLLFFKYFNFFINSLTDAVSIFNVSLNIHTLNLILPLGISFYTFRAISYLLDIDSGKIKPTSDGVVFLIYMSFFPTLLSGPIDKARTFIPQLEKKRVFNYDQAKDGLRQIVWGLFKKVVIADSCTTFTDHIFNNYEHLPASSLLLGALFNIIQIYADFSGYSDMAIGFSRLMGFNITKNFNFPFFAQNIAEFWRRWHISLTTWMTEYVFTPLSFIFRESGKAGLFLAILINFILVGLWHGANWTFIIYGFLNGCYFIPLIIKGTLNKKKPITKDKPLPSSREFINMSGTFTLVMLTSVIFRSESISKAYHYYSRLFPGLFFLYRIYRSKI
jgi:alginate O-acetyltransferase complex protein AlgI